MVSPEVEVYGSVKDSLHPFILKVSLIDVELNLPEELL